MITATATPPAALLDPDQQAAYHRDGFVRGGRVVDEPALAVLRAEVERVIAERGRPGVPQPYRITDMGQPGAPVWQIVDIWLGSAAFAALLRHPAIASAAAALLGARVVRLWHDQIQYKPAAGGGVNMWHQDSPYWPPLAPADSLVTAWIALDDADEGNGCMAMVPGSQRWGDTIAELHQVPDFGALPARFRGEPVTVRSCPVPAGHVHFHHPYTWHGSPANRSVRPRRAIALHLMCERTRHRADRRHLLSPEIPVGDGEEVRGPLFPLVHLAR